MRTRTRHTMKMLAACLTVASGAFAQPAEEAPAPKPNVLFLVIEDFQCAVGCYGDSLAKTPHMDKLAGEGIRFDRAYVQFPLCGPSRASLLTGRRPHSLGLKTNYDNYRDLVPDIVTFPQHFRAHGYHAVSIGKIEHHLDPVCWSERKVMFNGRAWHEAETRGNSDFFGQYDPASLPGVRKGAQQARRRLRENLLAQGMPEKVVGKRANMLRGLSHQARDAEDSAVSDGAVADRTIETLARLRDRGEPFLLMAGFFSTHIPYIAPRKYFDMYPLESVPIRREILAGANGIGEWVYLYDLPREPRIPETQLRELTRAYYACASFVDAQIGRVIEAVGRLGLEDDTIIVVWSDHGYSIGEHGYWGKGRLNEVCTRIPMLMRLPGSGTGGRTVSSLVETIDLFPSLCDLCGLAVPEDMEGKSFLPVLRDPSLPGKPAVFGRTPSARTVRTDRYRCTEYLKWDGTVQRCELYDHETDPGETTNLAGDPRLRDVRTRLEGLLQTAWTAKGRE